VLVKSGRTLNPSASSRMAVPSGFHEHGFQLPTRSGDADTARFSNCGQCLAVR
jgi:hypothetical protein